MHNIEGMKVLALGCHPDDIEHGCLGTLLKLQDAGADVSALVVTQGEMSNGSPRGYESERSFQKAGINLRGVWNYRDGYLQPEPKIIERLSEHLKNVNLLLTQTAWDTHQDHRALFEIALSASRRTHISIIGYHVYSCTQDFRPSTIIDITDVYKRKMEALKEHKSQRHQVYFSSDWIKNWHKDRTATAVGMHCVELMHVFQLLL